MGIKMLRADVVHGWVKWDKEMKGWENKYGALSAEGNPRPIAESILQR